MNSQNFQKCQNQSDSQGGFTQNITVMAIFTTASTNFQ